MIQEHRYWTAGTDTRGKGLWRELEPPPESWVGQEPTKRRCGLGPERPALQVTGGSHPRWDPPGACPLGSALASCQGVRTTFFWAEVSQGARFGPRVCPSSQHRPGVMAHAVTIRNLRFPVRKSLKRWPYWAHLLAWPLPWWLFIGTVSPSPGVIFCGDITPRPLSSPFALRAGRGLRSPLSSAGGHCGSVSTGRRGHTGGPVCWQVPVRSWLLWAAVTSGQTAITTSSCTSPRAWAVLSLLSSSEHHLGAQVCSGTASALSPRPRHPGSRAQRHPPRALTLCPGRWPLVQTWFLPFRALQGPVLAVVNRPPGWALPVPAAPAPRFPSREPARRASSPPAWNGVHAEVDGLQEKARGHVFRAIRGECATVTERKTKTRCAREFLVTPTCRELWSGGTRQAAGPCQHLSQPVLRAAPAREASHPSQSSHWAPPSSPHPARWHPPAF